MEGLWGAGILLGHEYVHFQGLPAMPPLAYHAQLFFGSEIVSLSFSNQCVWRNQCFKHRTWEGTGML